MGDGLHVTLLPASVSSLVAGAVSGQPRRCRVLAAFPGCVYVDLGAHERVLALLSADAVALPIGLHLTATSQQLDWALQPDDLVVVGGGRVRLPRLELVAARIRRPERVLPAPWRAGPSSPEPAPGSAGTGRGPRLLGEPGALGDLARALTSEALSGRAVDAGVRGLVGAGRGLTPSGDDVLCGILLTLAAVDAPRAQEALGSLRGAVGSCLGSTTSISAALLVAAGSGYAVPDVVRLVTLAVRWTSGMQVATADLPDELDAALHRVIGIGHSSGHDIVSGVVGALAALHASVDPTTREGACRG